MIKYVFKKGGKKESFDQEKIKKSISFALEKTDFSDQKKEEILKSVFSTIIEFLKEKKEVSTAEVEAEILIELDKLAPKAAENWRQYRLEKSQK